MIISACTNEVLPVKVESVILDKEELTITEGERKVLTVTVLPENSENQTIYWSSNKNEVATVEDGVVTAVSPGTAIITAISDEGGRKALCVVTVIDKAIPISGVSLDKENARVFLNGHLTLVATIQPLDATNRNLVWKSDNDSIAAVSDGVVTGIGLGRTSIWVETEDGGFTAECVIDVVEERQTQSKGPMTLDLGKVTATTAVLSGVLDIDQTAGYDMTGGGVGFIYAPIGVELTVDTAEKVQITNVDYANGFSKTLTGLQRDTEYQYTIYLYKNNICIYGKTQTFKTKDVTISVDDVNVTNTTATFVGKVIRDEADASVKVGIQYSKASSFESTSSLEVTPEEDGGYNVTCDGLYIATEYYYRTYVCQDGVYEYSEAVTFTTNAVTVELNVESNTQTTVQFKGKIDPSTAIDEVQIAVLINTSETVTKSDYSKKYTLTAEDIKEDGSFDVSMSGLEFGTTYYYTYYVLNSNAYSYGSVRNFRTEDVQVNLSVEEITQTTAIFKGKAELTEPDVVEIGIRYSTKRTDFSSSSLSSSAVEISFKDELDGEGNFNSKETGLFHTTKYYYAYYIKQDGKYTFGEVLTFMTTINTLTVETVEIQSSYITLKVTFPGDIPEYIYWFGTQKECEGKFGSILITDIRRWMVLNQDDESLVNIMRKHGQLSSDGTIRFDGLTKNTSYVLAIMEKGEQNYTNVKVYFAATFSADPGQVVWAGTDAWNAAKESVKIRWIEGAFEQGLTGLYSRYAFDFSCQTDMTAFVVCGSDTYYDDFINVEDAMINIEYAAGERYDYGTPRYNKDGSDILEPGYYKGGVWYPSGGMMNVYDFYVHGIPQLGTLTYFYAGYKIGQEGCWDWDEGCAHYQRAKEKIAECLTIEKWKNYGSGRGVEGEELEAYAKSYLQAYKPFYEDMEPIIFVNDGSPIRVINGEANGVNEKGEVHDRVIVMLKDKQGNYYEPMFFEVPNYFNK